MLWTPAQDLEVVQWWFNWLRHTVVVHSPPLIAPPGRQTRWHMLNALSFYLIRLPWKYPRPARMPWNQAQRRWQSQLQSWSGCSTGTDRYSLCGRKNTSVYKFHFKLNSNGGKTQIRARFDNNLRKEQVTQTAQHAHNSQEICTWYVKVPVHTCSTLVTHQWFLQSPRMGGWIRQCCLSCVPLL